MALSRRERLKIFALRIFDFPRSGSADEAKALIDRVLNEVEDQFSEVAFAPDTRGDDGRMYPAQLDSQRPVPGQIELRRFRHRGDSTYIGRNGAILIRSDRTGFVLLDVPGPNGEHIIL